MLSPAQFILQSAKKQPKTRTFYFSGLNSVRDRLLLVNNTYTPVCRYDKSFSEQLLPAINPSITSIYALLQTGLKNRATGSNSINEHSSRSHSMLSLHIDSDMQDPDDDNVYVTKHGKLTFVDLAGNFHFADLLVQFNCCFVLLLLFFFGGGGGGVLYEHALCTWNQFVVV